MKTLSKKISHLRSHTWKDIGGLGGILLDGAFFTLLILVSSVIVVVGAIAVVLDYVFSPLLSLVSMCRGSSNKYQDDAVLQEDGTLGHRPPASVKTP